MKIIKFKKERDNRYTIYFDNDSKIKLYDDVIIKYNLLSNKKVDDNKLKEIIEYNDNLSAYYTGIKYISKKMRTKLEVQKYLEKTFTKRVTNDAIEKIDKEGLFNNDIYLRAYINDQILLTNKGPNKIKNELIKLGFDELEIKPYVDNIESEVWVNKIKKLIDKKTRMNHQYSINKLKTKLVYELSNLGYYKYMIDEEIENASFTNDNNIIEKEYNKILSRLSKKYEGSNLDYQVKMRLMQKGFTIDEISSLKKDY